VSGIPSRQADVAAEALRALNHATQPGATGLRGPVDVYDTLAGLELLTARLPQALAQLQAFLDAEHAAGRIGVVDGPHAEDPATLLAATAQSLLAAADAAAALQQALAHAHELLACAARTG
jgi:hypothetical protein